MPGSTAQYPHIVIPGVEPWGHARPLCAFATKVVLTRDVYVTLFTPPRVTERIKNEIARGFGPQDAERLKLIRVVALDNVVEGANVTNFAEGMKIEQERYFTSFMVAYEQLLEEKPVTCFTTKTEFPAVSAPKMLVVDFIVGTLIKMVPKLSKNKAQIVGFCSAMATFFHLNFAPVERGGRGDFKVKVLQEAERSGRPTADVAEDIFHDFTDDVIQMPGFPKMYHWELDPQDTKFLTKGLIGPLWLELFDTWAACDGMILTSPEAYEPPGVTAIKDWYRETNRDVWAIGPLLPSTATQESIAGEEAQSDKSAEIRKFMDSVLAKHGAQSMLYISFGSAFWVSEPEKLEVFIEVVIEKNIPFVFSHGSPFAKLTDTFKAKVEQSGLGLLSQWSPQQTILSHPALGWFISHCGHNSTLEAVSSGAPMICWPFHADQPANAVNLTENHDVAYELIEVRAGNGRKPIYRTGQAPLGTLDALRAEVRSVLEKAFGEDGARKRANVKKLQQKIDSAWDKGGSADVDMIRLLDSLY